MSLRLSGGRIEDDYVDLFEMFEKSMQVVELQIATGVVTAEFAFSFEYVYSIQKRVVHWSFSSDVY
jgi:hypothetical protein